MSTVLEVLGDGNDAEKKVVVTYDDNEVDVEWLCGGHYIFTKDYLKSAVETFEASAVIPEVFYRDHPNKGGRGTEFYARLVSSRFEADSDVFETAMGVRWDDLKAALLEATSGKKTRRRGILRRKSES